MAVALAAPAILQFFGDDGAPLAGGTLTTQVGGVNYPTYSDPNGNFALPNPIVLNSRGEVATAAGQSTPLYIAPNVTYTWFLQDSLGNTIYTPTIAQQQTILTAATVGAALYPTTPVELAVPITPQAFQYAPFDARREGAAATAAADDSAALTTVTAIAQQGLYDIPLLSYQVGGGYQIANTVTMSYAGQGQVNYKGAKIHGPTIVYPTMSTYAFQMIADAYGQQQVQLKLEDMMVVGNGTNHPSFMRTSWVYFSECNGIKSFNSGPVIDWQYGGQNVSRGCTAFGGTGAVGFNVYRSHDAYVTEFHAYGCATGVQAAGLNSAGQDGNVNFSNGTSHGNSAYGFNLSGLYTATLINITAEVQPVNVYIQSCQYSLMWGAFLGPTNAAPNYSIHYAYNGTYGNDFNIIGGVNAQNESQWDYMQSSIIADSIFSNVPSSITGAAISLNTSALNLLNGLSLRNNGAYSYIQDVNSSQNIINGGRYEDTIYLQGTKAQRSGNVIMPNYLYGGIKTDDAVQGQFALSEYVRYFDGTRINETSFGYLLPYTAKNGTIAVSSAVTLDVTTLVPAGASATNAYEAEFYVYGGSSGSTSGAKILVLRTLDATLLTILANIGNRGTLQVSVSGSVITATNNSGSVTCPYVMTLTKLAGY